MKLIRKIDNYINDKNIRIISSNNYVNITNYNKILDFDSDNIDIELNNYNLLIKGNNLVINKMYDNELLIKGKIDSIIYR